MYINLQCITYATMNNVSRGSNAMITILFYSYACFNFKGQKYQNKKKNLIKNIFYFNDPPSERRESIYASLQNANKSTYDLKKKEKHINEYIKKSSAILCP